MDFYEFSISKKVTQKEIYNTISNLLKLPQDKIGSSDDFYTSIGEANQLEIGLEIQWQHYGFKTLVNCVSNKELDKYEQINLAYDLSQAFNSEVAIGDVTSESKFSEGSFLVITPNNFIYKAYQVSNDEDIFDLQSYSDKVPLKDFLSQLIPYQVH